MGGGRSGRGGRGDDFQETGIGQLINGVSASATRVASCPPFTGYGRWADDAALKHCFVYR